LQIFRALLRIHRDLLQILGLLGRYEGGLADTQVSFGGYTGFFWRIFRSRLADLLVCFGGYVVLFCGYIGLFADV